jgi:DNA-binding NarL/FixJ family response regulator
MHPSGVTVGPDGRARVLRACIVDDHVAVRQWLTSTLGALGIDVCATSETIVEGVQAILAHRPDLAVVDNRLPDGRGIDLCREVSGSLPEVALILHTGMISPLEVTQAHEAGVSRVALKSIHGDELIAAVRDVATRSRAALG